MFKQKASFTIIILALVALMAVTSYAQEKKPYKVGAVFDITGKASWLGEPERNTAKMIEEEVNAKGGIKNTR